MTWQHADHPDAWAWLEVDDERTRRWVRESLARVGEQFPDHETCEVQHWLEQAMLGRQAVRRPTQAGRWCYRFDASTGFWLRAPSPGGGPLGPWQPVRLGVNDTGSTLAAQLVPCPYPSAGRAGRAMVTVSHRGTDATSSREVDLDAAAEVDDGLHVPLCVHHLSWDGPDALLVSHREQDSAGFRWVVDRTRRGDPWDAARRVHEFPSDRVAASIVRDPTAPGTRYLMVEWLDHRHRRYHVSRGDREAFDWRPVAVPSHVRVQLLGEVALLIPLQPWRPSDRDPEVPAGSLLSAPVEELLGGSARPRVVHRPGAGERMLNLAAGRDRVLIEVRDAHTTRLLAAHPQGGGAREIARTDASTRLRASPVDVANAAGGNAFWIESAGPVTPPRLARVDAERPDPPRILEQGLATFRHHDFVVQHHRAELEAMPPVPFTVVAPRDLSYDGENPTVLTGYGAFSVPGHLDYLDLTGLSWLDRPGPDGRRCVYVFAHAGAGPAPPDRPWERLARSVRLFRAVATRLAEIGIARPGRLGVLGVSHGGVLVMNAVLDDPDAFGAVVCRSAVLDLVNYPRLDGTAWTAEYGDPREPAAREALQALSPYHRISEGTRCPPVLLWSADNDDRVAAAHSRKTAARLAAAGGEVLYLETAGGGHDQLAASPVGAHGLAVVASFFRRHLVGR